MTDHAEVMRIAEGLDAVPETGADPALIQEAADALRRQSAETERLRAELLDSKVLLQDWKRLAEQRATHLEVLRNQEPVATLDFRTKGWREFLDALRPHPDGTKLYLAAGAQPVPSGLETRMYQDAEGKRPVTGVNQPVGLVRQSWAPKRKPLAEPEIFKAYTTLTGKRLPYIGSSRAELIAVVRMTEAAHGITGDEA